MKPSVIDMILIRGLPGSGRTTLARMLTSDNFIFEANDYFKTEGGYVFKPEQLGVAHGFCKDRVYDALSEVYAGKTGSKIVVTNTFSTKEEVEPYFDLAAEAEEDFGNKAYVRVTVVDLFNAGLHDADLAKRSPHDVPVGAITRMRLRWQFNLRRSTDASDR